MPAIEVKKLRSLPFHRTFLSTCYVHDMISLYSDYELLCFVTYSVNLKLRHGSVILFCDYHSQMNDIQLETDG